MSKRRAEGCGQPAVSSALTDSGRKASERNGPAGQDESTSGEIGGYLHLKGSENVEKLQFLFIL